MRVVNHGLGESSVNKALVSGRSRVDEDDGIARVQEVPGSLEGRVTEVLVARSVAGVEDDAVSLEDVQGVDDLGVGSLRVEERGDGGKEAVASRFLLADLGRVLVGVAAEGNLLFAHGHDLTTGSSDAEEGEGDVLLAVEGQVGLYRP